MIMDLLINLIKKRLCDEGQSKLDLFGGVVVRINSLQLWMKDANDIYTKSAAFPVIHGLFFPISKTAPADGLGLFHGCAMQQNKYSNLEWLFASQLAWSQHAYLILSYLWDKGKGQDEVKVICFARSKSKSLVISNGIHSAMSWSSR